MRRTAFLTIAFVGIITNFAHAQNSRPAIALKVGVTRYLQQDQWYRDQLRYAIYPEVQISSEFLTWSHDSLALRAAIYGNFWDDGVKVHIENCVDCVTYSYNSRIIGVRLALALKKFPLVPIGFWGGWARHFIHADYVGGIGFNGGFEKNIQRVDDSSEFGIFAFKKFSRHLEAIIEFQQYFMVERQTSPVLPNQLRAVKLGLAYLL